MFITPRAGLAAVLLCSTAHAGTTAPTVTALASLSPFAGPALGGLSPDGSGGFLVNAFTGTATNKIGAILDLTPPAGGTGAWTTSRVYTFGAGADGVLGAGLIVPDGQGGLLGETFAGGSAGFGTLFRLVPPAIAGGAWSHSVVYDFTGGASGAATPTGNLLSDGAGHFFGTSERGGPGGKGTVYELTQPVTPGGVWTSTVIASFTGGSVDAAPPQALAMDGAGALYLALAEGGPNHGDGQVIKLTQSSPGVWTRTVLHSFGHGKDGSHTAYRVTLDGAGNVYGATYNGGSAGHGIVYELSAANNYAETILHDFSGGAADGSAPAGNLILSADGVLTGTTAAGGTGNAGTVFTLTPNGAGYDYAVTYNFAAVKAGGVMPKFDLTPSAVAGGFYSLTLKGGAGDRGYMFEYLP